VRDEKVESVPEQRDGPGAPVSGLFERLPERSVVVGTASHVAIGEHRAHSCEDSPRRNFPLEPLFFIPKTWLSVPGERPGGTRCADEP
jgi:hypothetical protein